MGADYKFNGVFEILSVPLSCKNYSTKIMQTKSRASAIHTNIINAKVTLSDTFSLIPEPILMRKLEYKIFFNPSQKGVL